MTQPFVGPLLDAKRTKVADHRLHQTGDLRPPHLLAGLGGGGARADLAVVLEAALGGQNLVVLTVPLLLRKNLQGVRVVHDPSPLHHQGNVLTVIHQLKGNGQFHQGKDQIHHQRKEGQFLLRENVQRPRGEDHYHLVKDHHLHVKDHHLLGKGLHLLAKGLNLQTKGHLFVRDHPLHGKGPILLVKLPPREVTVILTGTAEVQTSLQRKVMMRTVSPHHGPILQTKIRTAIMITGTQTVMNQITATQEIVIENSNKATIATTKRNRSSTRKKESISFQKKRGALF